MTTQEQDSSRPQQSQDSPHLGLATGLMTEVMLELVEAGMVVAVQGRVSVWCGEGGHEGRGKSGETVVGSEQRRKSSGEGLFLPDGVVEKGRLKNGLRVD